MYVEALWDGLFCMRDEQNAGWEWIVASLEIENEMLLQEVEMRLIDGCVE